MSEAPIRIGNRDELVFLLSEAAELEHGIMCQYLFAAFTMRSEAEDGLDPEVRHAVARWERTVSEVAAQEMMHLALVSNLLSAVGAAPYFRRPNFPLRPGHYPPGLHLDLIPFSERALRHFLFLERPEGMDLEDAEGFEALADSVPLGHAHAIVPHQQTYSTFGHLYRGIEDGFRHLTTTLGERELFCGHAGAQATGEFFLWDEMVPVTDLESACAAIETIVEQGEGARGEWKEAHFGRFHAVLEEFLALKAERPDFEPARPAVAAFTRPPADVPDALLISVKSTGMVADLFNASYQALLQLIIRFFLHTEESEKELSVLADVAVGMMVDVIRPLGRMLTTLPVAPNRDDITAGPTFDVYRTTYYVPHRHAAWRVLHERLVALGRAAQEQADDMGPILESVADRLIGYADRLGPHVFRV
jgi:hypothetical protein